MLKKGTFFGPFGLLLAARLGSLLGLKVVHLVIESGIPAGMPVLSIPTTVHYAAVDRFWDGYVCCALWPGCGQLLHCCLL